jgi:FSR family fosmidomycin resistance protein-like MFS transporter
MITRPIADVKTRRQPAALHKKKPSVARLPRVRRNPARPRPRRRPLDRGADLVQHRAMIEHTLFSRDNRVNALIGAGHFLSHFYALCLPPLFVAWARTFGVSYAELGLSVALMAATAALAQTPVGILVDRHGARPFLVGGALVMALSISAMGLATTYWQIVGLAVLSGLGNSVFHPADYAILSGSVSRERIGRAYAFHTFSGYVGFAAAPPVTAGLMLLIGWRASLVLLGLLGVPVVLMILWHSAILAEEKHRAGPAEKPAAGGAALLLTRPILFLCAFYMVSSMATAGIQSWLITVLHKTHGMTLTAASSALTGYLAGSLFGILAGGWVADRSARHLTHVVLWTTVGAAILLVVGMVPLAAGAVCGMLVTAGLLLGTSRTPRDMMVKQAAPAGQVGKVFGFVSAGLSLGSALSPVPYGMLIDARRPDLVLVAVAVLLVASLLFAAGARIGVRGEAAAVAAE